MSIDLNTQLEAQAKAIKTWRESPFLYLNENIGITQIWELQARVIRAIPQALAEHKPIVIGSGHSLGKDYIVSCIANWFLDCFTPSKVIETAPTDRQVKKIMWAETLQKYNMKAVKFGRAFTDPYIEIRKEDWFLIGFTTKDTGAAAESGGGKFQGFHAQENICVIASEAQAIEDPIFDQIDALTTAPNSLVIYIGNPTRATGRFARMLKDKENNISFNFSCLENPNYKQRKIVIPGLATYEWVEDKRKRWGEGDPRWIGRVLGQVPDNTLSNTFPLSWINHTRERCGLLHIHSADGGVAVDSAGEGVDENIFLSGRGGEVMDSYSKTIMTPSEIALKAVEMCRQVRGQFIVFDCDGVGIGPYLECMKFPEDFIRGITILKFHGCSQKTTEIDGKRMYENQRAEASFITRERGFAGKCSINEHDKELIDDLMEEEFFENKKGLIQIEDKKDIKDRLGRSPGRGDAYKMLQWAFDQMGKTESQAADYPMAEGNNLPTHGRMDSDVLGAGSQLPTHGRM